MTKRPSAGGTPHRSTRSDRPIYIHELDDWPNFRWDAEAVFPSLIRASRRQAEVADRLAALDPQVAAEAKVRNLTDSAVASSRIEGENPNRAAIRDFIARSVVAETHPATRSNYAGPGIAVVTADAATNYAAPLTRERLHAWHRRLFPGAQRIAVGRWRDDRHGPMRVVSGGPVGRNHVVHFEAPPADRLEHEMQRFLDWLNQPEPEPDLLKAAVAHLWFVTIHPYDDGNGRIGRAITDLVLARCDGTPLRSYSISGETMRRRAAYYAALQVTQSGSMDVTSWMVWFLECLTSAMSDV